MLTPVTTTSHPTTKGFMGHLRFKSRRERSSYISTRDAAVTWNKIRTNRILHGTTNHHPNEKSTYRKEGGENNIDPDAGLLSPAVVYVPEKCQRGDLEKHGEKSKDDLHPFERRVEVLLVPRRRRRRTTNLAFDIHP